MSPGAEGAAAALAAAGGVYLLYTSFAYPSPARPSRRRWRPPLVEMGVSPLEASATMFAALAAGAAAGFLLFASPVAAAVAGVLTMGLPLSGWRARVEARRERAGEAWPRVLEEIRLRTGSLGRSIPQALFDAGRHAPPEWRSAFAEAEREWLLTTDFSRTLTLLKSRLADATADVVCETLVVAQELGGADLDGRLRALIEDRNQDLEDRKDAATRQAGVRFARRFVLLVPLGMALAGLSIGTGRSAYASPGGQAAVVAALVSVAACWAWSGRLMRLPRPPRVFE